MKLFAKGIMCMFLLFLPWFLPSSQVAAGSVNQSVDEYLKQMQEEKKKGEQDQEKNQKQKQEKENNQETEQVGISFFDVLRLILTMAFIILLLFLLLKFINKKNKGYQEGKFIENLGGTSLGANRSVQLVRVGEKILVLGVGETIQKLDSIEDADQYNQLINEYNHRLEQQTAPVDFLASLIKKQKPKSEQDVTPSFGASLKRELAEMKKDRQVWAEKFRQKGNQRDE